jgi:putative protease
MKDMSLMEHVQALAQAGVQTLKIEGRMKRPEYVAAAVTACRAARAGEAYDEQTLRAVFSRSGFTDGYLRGERDKDMFGYRTREDVTGAEGVLQSLAGLYHKEMPLVPVNMKFIMSTDESALTVTDGDHSVTVKGAAPQEAVSRPTDEEAAQKNLTKTGGTQYYVNQFSAQLATGLRLPASELNALRRQALEKLDEKRGQRPALQPQGQGISLLKPYTKGGSALWARFYDPQQMPDTTSLEKIILPVETITPTWIQRLGQKLVAQLPAVVFGSQEEKLELRLSQLKDFGLQELWTDNIYGIPLGRKLELTVRGGFGLNSANSQAVVFYEQQGLASFTPSFEISMGAIRALGGTLPRGIVAYGHLPLMEYRNCPLRAQVGCASCGGEGTLTDRKDIVFPVECGAKQYSTLLNSVPLHIAERDDPADYRLLYFTREDKAACAQIIEDFRQNRKGTMGRTGGLYYRDLL